MEQAPVETALYVDFHLFTTAKRFPALRSKVVATVASSCTVC